MKYEMNGVYSMSVYGEVEADTEKEAKEKFRKMVETSMALDKDWIEETTCEAHLVYDYSFKLEQVMHNSGLCRKVKSTPKKVNVLYPTNEFGLVEYYVAELVDGGYIYFIVIGDEVLIPCWMTNNKIRLDVVGTDTDLKNRVFESYWIDKRGEVSTFTKKGVKLTVYNLKAKNLSRTTLGNRISYLIDKTDAIALIVEHSNVDSLEVTDADDPKVSYTARYSSAYDEVPDSLTKVEAII